MSNNHNDDSFMNDFSVNAVATAGSNSQNSTKNTFKKDTSNDLNKLSLKNEQTTGKKRSIGKFCKNCGTILLDEIEGKELSGEAADCVCVENSEGIISSSRSQWGQIMLYRRLKLKKKFHGFKKTLALPMHFRVQFLYKKREN